MAQFLRHLGRVQYSYPGGLAAWGQDGNPMLTPGNRMNNQSEALKSGALPQDILPQRLEALRASGAAPMPPQQPQTGGALPWQQPAPAAPYMPPAQGPAINPALIRMASGGIMQPGQMQGGYAPNVSAALARLAKR